MKTWNLSAKGNFYREANGWRLVLRQGKQGGWNYTIARTDNTLAVHRQLGAATPALAGEVAVEMMRQMDGLEKLL